MASLSVIVPVYNREHLIGETLRSLLNQSLPADEIILVDDGSSDATAESVEKEFASFSRSFSGIGKLPELKVIRQENAGPAAARNRGFVESRGDFIHFFDSDDIALPNKHESQVRALRKTGADIAIGPWQKGYLNGSTFRPFHHVLQQRGLPRGSLLKALLTDWSLVPHCGLFTRQIVERAGGFPEDCFGVEDTFFLLSCFLAGARCTHTTDTLELYRIGNIKITDAGDSGERHLKEWAKVLLKMRSKCLSSGLDPARWFGFRARCWRAMRDLERFGEVDSVLLQGLRDVADSSPDFVYAGTGLFRQWYGGLKYRIIGDRSCSFYQTGPLTKDQISLVNEAGYEIAW